MQLTKYGHSCVRFDDGDRSLVIDPGMFSDVPAALDGADAVLVTHEHVDHLDVERLRAAAQADPRLRIWAPASVSATLADLGEQVVAVGAGESFDAAGFAVATFGGQHALIHPLIPVIANVAYLVEGAVYHPGDSLIVPPAPVQVLLLPAAAPWSRMADVTDFAASVRAPRAYGIHDAVITDAWQGILANTVKLVAGGFGVEYHRFTESITV